jgi:leader peptidase (prepilin peptidase)/N-methyltransferase
MSHRLPDLLVLPSYPIAFVLLFVPTVVTGQWGALLRPCWPGLRSIWAISCWRWSPPGGGGLGFGDVKLAGVLGCCWAGWAGARQSSRSSRPSSQVASSHLILLLAGRASRSSRIAFGPSMILGAVGGG